MDGHAECAAPAAWYWWWLPRSQARQVAWLLDPFRPSQLSRTRQPPARHFGRQAFQHPAYLPAHSLALAEEGASVIPKPIFVEVRLTSNGCRTYGHNGYFKSLKEIVHFYNTRDVLLRCAAHDPSAGTSCWPAPETTENMNMNKNKVGNLGLSDNEEDALSCRR
jgi:hypothetical protein